MNYIQAFSFFSQKLINNRLFFQIESGGIASQDGRIQDGDQIVEINDVQVVSRDQVSYFKESFLFRNGISETSVSF